MPRPDDAVVVREERTDTERLDAAPVSERDSRPETDRREDRELREEREEELEREDELELLDEPRLPCPVTPVGDEPISASGDTTGASPHVSQYSSPPPTSS
nr:hypothetical protein [Streptomyces coryli]